MIITITGLPGNGKTLFALNWVKAKAEKEGRQVFYSGITDLNTAVLPWTECEPTKWFELPPGSIIVIDECQRVFRPRMHGSAVPDFVAQLETHRHLGVDLVLITQHPMLIDSNVRRLVGLHFHVVRKFGLQAATVHEWGAIKETCDKNREDSSRHDFVYPKAAYTWYKSAEVHTHKARIPARVWWLGAVVLGLAGAVYTGYSFWSKRLSGQHADEMAQTMGVTPASTAPRVVTRTAAASSSGPMTTEAYLRAHAPRIPGLPHTAPVYDETTKPQEAPYPAACIASYSRCHCYTTQATRLHMPEDLCRTIARDGFFMAWRKPEPAAQPASQAVGGPAKATPGAELAPPPGSLVTSYTPD
jgi:zona occludens toxin